MQGPPDVIRVMGRGVIVRVVCVGLLLCTAVACTGDPVARDGNDQDAAASPGPSGARGPVPTTRTLPTDTPSTTLRDASSSPSGMDGGPAGSSMNPADAAGAMPEPLTLCEPSDNDNDGGLSDDDAGAAPPGEEGCVVVGDIRLQYKAANVDPVDKQGQPVFNLINDGERAVPLTELTIRYWLRDSSSGAPFVFWCDYAQIDCRNVVGAFYEVERDGADHYMEVSFSGATLGAGQASGEIQTRFNREDWPFLDETDDYSYDATKTAFEDWHKATLYLNGRLVWGLEPPTR